ncbi:GntR family transcriptional regulator [Thermoflavimicrobium daqui]|jgi:GntR family transcriptional regulator|uniref:GntR family transcriptional regulator n=1 Tax=Thermoflavimicrobium daqui TaxID=2137476 RepID=A0A364K727_9BACL|nr:GntR family transcriptional regulator [Thermoflavimicrobium daqui]RAL26105.1 GntR family transcriptional regulator [Thermoflavimicrobium daqui]
MKIIISNSSSDPIYEQIAKQIRDDILKGKLMGGDVLPSIRVLAKELGISVITTKRAYEKLEQEGFVETVGGKGTYVAEQNKDLIRERQLRILEEKIVEMIEVSKTVDITYEELLQMIRVIYQEVE